MSTCNRLDLQTLGSQPAMAKNLPDHWSEGSCKRNPPSDTRKPTPCKLSYAMWTNTKTYKLEECWTLTSDKWKRDYMDKEWNWAHTCSPVVLGAFWHNY